MYIRNQWIENSEFHDAASTEVLQEVARRVQGVLSEGKLPVVIFDLDSTLFDVGMRSYRILSEWLAHPEAQSFTETLSSLSKLEPSEMKYSLEDVWSGRDLDPTASPHSEALKHAKQYWRKRFFGNEYLVHDQPTDGALEFVRALHEMGAKIVYLTGRDVPLMAFGTYDQLRFHRFPIESERTRLILKPKRHIDDLEFKAQAVEYLKSVGEVVATFENEPKNLVAMSKVLGPNTMHVFIETVSSDHPAPAGKNLYRIQNFRMST